MFLIGCSQESLNDETSNQKTTDEIEESTPTPLKVLNINDLHGRSKTDCGITLWTVPNGETWKLTWNSPYKDGQIVPSYDLRVFGGVYIGERIGGRTLVHRSLVAEDDGDGKMLDVVAGQDKASTIWLYEGSSFYTANEKINAAITIYVFK